MKITKLFQSRVNAFMFLEGPQKKTFSGCKDTFLTKKVDNRVVSILLTKTLGMIMVSLNLSNTT